MTVVFKLAMNTDTTGSIIKLCTGAKKIVAAVKVSYASVAIT